MAEGITGKMKDFFGLGSVDSYEDPYHYDEFDDDRDDRDRRDHRDHREPAEDPRSFLRSFILWSSHQQGCLRLSFLIRVEISPFVLL
jgi:hypothetical protein